MTTRLQLVLIFQLLINTLISCNDPHAVIQNEDDYYEKCRRLSLSENKIGQVYMYKIVKEEIDEIYVNLLGRIVTKDGNVLSIVNSINYTGLFEDSRRGTAKIYLYDRQNIRIGSYYVGDALSLPTRIQGTNLIFSSLESECSDTTMIDFFDSIPKKIFVSCKDSQGDVYSLDTNNY